MSADQATSNLEARRAWLAHMRHELRTPLNAIIGYSEMLLEDARAEGLADFAPDLEKIQAAGERLLKTVNEILSPDQAEESQAEAGGGNHGVRLRHEMRTPLTGSIGYSEMLIELAADAGLENFVADLERIRAAGFTLLTLLDDAVQWKEAGHEDSSAALAEKSLPSMALAASHAPEGHTVEVERGRLLVVDDSPINCDVLSRRLQRLGHTVTVAGDGLQALALMREQPFDLVLLDIMMPEMNGYEALQRMKADSALRDLPVIMISALYELDSVAKCIELGAADYLPKPFNPVLLKARVDACLEKKRFRDKEIAYQQELQRLNGFIRKTFGRYTSDALVDRLLESEEGLNLGGQTCEVTILMSDLRGFTAVAERLTPPQVVTLLNIYLGVMTEVIMRYEGMINEFIGDAIFVIFGAPIWRPDHAERAVACATAMQLAMAEVNEQNRAAGLPEIAMGIGINTGEVVAGNIGSSRRAKYGVIGSQVNLTARIESYTLGGQILISEATRLAANCDLRIEDQMAVESKGVKGPTSVLRVSGIGGGYNLFLPEVTEQLVRLKQPVRLRYFLIEDKHTSQDFQEGLLAGLSARRAEIQSARAIARHSNLKLQFIGADGEVLPGDLYGKVSGQAGADAQNFHLSFTAVPPELETLFQRLLSGSAD
ncbi:MAG: adenylate/guanylate cyclase domain-containing protein [Blastocatellales bacterium]